MSLSVRLQVYARNPLSVLKRTWRDARNSRRNFPAGLRHEFARKVVGNYEHRSKNNQTVLILCTGPSAAHLPVERMAGQQMISVSHFHNHPHCAILRPRYHIIAANHDPFGSDLYVGYMKELERSEWKFTCFFGYTPYAHSILHYLRDNPPPKFDYSFYRTERNFFKKREAYLLDRAWDFTRSIPPSTTVLVQAIQLAVFLGYKRIVLTGCDHDYINHFGESSVPHFYEKEKGHDDSVHLRGINTEKWFNILGERWATYRMMRTYCSARGIEIVNATPGSKLDVFPLVPLESVL
jgi:hypothetical protein